MERRPPTARWIANYRFSLPTLAGVLLVLGFLSGACSSLPKEALATRLAALNKNRPIGSLSRLPMTVDLGLGERPYELLYHHAPARHPSGGPPILLVHNTPSTLYSWTELIYGGEDFSEPGLAETRDVYAIEVIGHGMAIGDASPYTFERCARFVEAAIGALELDQVHLVGSSYGGEFAWRTALNAPDRIASLVLLDSSGYARREGDWLSEEVLMRESSLAKYGWLLNSESRVRSALEPHFNTLPPDRVEEFFLVCENAHNWSAMIDLVKDETGEREAEIADIQVPTLVIWGAKDSAYSLDRYGRRFATQIGKAQLMVVEDTGHYPHEERPAQVLEALARFYGDWETEE